MAANYCKVLELIMASHMVKHMDKPDLLYDLQHAYIEKRPCETQLTMLVEDLARSTRELDRPYTPGFFKGI